MVKKTVMTAVQYRSMSRRAMFSWQKKAGLVKTVRLVSVYRDR